MTSRERKNIHEPLNQDFYKHPIISNILNLEASLEWSLLVAKGAQIDQTPALPTKV